MTVLSDVGDLIETMAPDAICDDCIAKRLKLSIRQHANQKTRELVHRLSQSRHSGNLILNTKQRVAPAHGESFVWIGALALGPGFDRQRDNCAVCGSMKLVIRRS